MVDNISGNNEKNEQLEGIKEEMLNLNSHLNELANKPTPDMNAVTDYLHSINRSIETVVSVRGKVGSFEENKASEIKQAVPIPGTVYLLPA